MGASSQRDTFLMALVESALEQPPSLREAYMRAACNGDVEFFGEAWAQLEWEVRMRRLFAEQLTRSSDSAEPFVPIDGSILIADKYRVDRRLGQGGMGIVYAVVHLGLQKRFALKVIKSPAAGGDVFLSRFRSEAEALGRLKHPNIVEVTDSGV